MSDDSSENDLCQNQCNLSAGDVEAILEGKEVGPWLFDGTAVSVRIDPSELEKIDAADTDDDVDARYQNPPQYYGVEGTPGMEDSDDGE